MDLKIERFFYNVGDALFTKETLTVNSNCYTIMYDCGSSNEKLINKAIKDGEKIDLIFLSHYDADHIKGLQKIVKKADVKQLILPMISYPDACMAICMNLGKNQVLIWNFFIDPQSQLEKPIRITYVYGESNQREESYVNKIGLNLSKEFIENKGILKGQHIIIEDVIDWIYFPFNPFSYDKQAEDEFFEKLSHEVDCGKMINRLNIKNIWKDKKIQGKIKKVSLELLKRFPGKPNINATSMTLYSGPQNETLDKLTGCLYTGDYDAKTLDSVNNILTYYSGYLDFVGIIQIPHHGSEYSNADLFYESFKNKIAILSVKRASKKVTGVDNTMKILENNNLKTYITDFQGKEYLKNNEILQVIEKGVRIIVQPLSLFIAVKLKYILTFIVLCLSLQVYSQDLSVRSFNVDLSDQTANVKERLDLNKQPCGLIKVSLPLRNVVFEGDIIGNVEYSAGEYWVYVIDDTEMLTIKHDDYHALNLTLSEKVKSRRTYRLTINAKSEQGISKENSSETLKKANEYFENGDYINALIYYKQLADNENNAAAQNNLGYMFMKPYGVQQNYNEAVKYFHKSAKQGNKYAQRNIAVMYEFGHGVTIDYMEAVKWYRKSAEQGHAIAQWNLGSMYYNGKGVSKDYVEAIKWYMKSANQGDASAQAFLGHMYQEGYGVSKNDVEAIKWFRKSAEQGSFIGQFGLGVMYLEGRGISKNYAETSKWIRKSAEQGFAGAQYFLGIMYEQGHGVTMNYKEAAKWYQKAAKQGSSEAEKALKQIDGLY